MKWTVAALVMAGSWWLTQSNFGLILRSITENEQRISYLGYDVANFKIFMWPLSLLPSPCKLVEIIVSVLDVRINRPEFVVQPRLIVSENLKFLFCAKFINHCLNRFRLGLLLNTLSKLFSSEQSRLRKV